MLVQDLLEEIEIELEYIEIVLMELEKLYEKPQDVEPTIVEVTAAGGFLHNFYNGIENIFKRILKFNKIKLEENHKWHKELLKKFFDKENKFAFLDHSIYDDLMEILKFRHLYIHGYGFLLDWSLLKPLIKKALKSYREFKPLCQSYTLSLRDND